MSHPRAVLSLVALVVLLVAIKPASVSAGCEDGSTPAYFSLRTDYFFNCPLVFPTGSPAFVAIEAYAVPFRKARFSLPNPPVGVVVQETWNFPHTGDRVTGIELDLGSCSTQELVTLGYLTIINFGGGANCVAWTIDDGAEIEECDGTTGTGVSLPAWVTATPVGCFECPFQECPTVRPYELFPPDGAAAVPLDVALTWGGRSNYCSVWSSTDPACDSGQTYSPADCNAGSFSPGFLQPSTTYYWRVRIWPDACQGQGLTAIHSFTTEGPVSATTTTWGRVKVMYSD